MTEPAKDFWARADRDLLDRWPKDEAGAPEPCFLIFIRIVYIYSIIRYRISLIPVICTDCQRRILHIPFKAIYGNCNIL